MTLKLIYTSFLCLLSSQNYLYKPVYLKCKDISLSPEGIFIVVIVLMLMTCEACDMYFILGNYSNYWGGEFEICLEKLTVVSVLFLFQPED